MHRTLLIVLCVVLVLLFAVGVAAADFKVLLFNGTETQTQQIEAGDVEQVKAVLQMESGSITVKGGTDALLDAQFKMNMDEFKPAVRYDEMDGHGCLTVIQPPEPDGVYLGVKRNEWNIRLNDRMPMSLGLSAGGGDLTVDFDGTNLTALTLDTGSGSAKIVLHGDHPLLQSAAMDAGSGDLQDSRLDGSFPLLETVSANTGGGNIDDLALTGTFAVLAEVKISSGSGNISSDLSGTWQTDAAVNVSTGAGDIDLSLPRESGVRVTVSTGAGRVDVKGLHKVR